MRTTVLFAAASFASFVAGVEDVEVHIMSFNIRTSQASADAGSACGNWNGVRKDNVLHNIKTIGADFVGTQETSDAQKVYLDTELAGTYSVIGETSGSLNGNAAEWNAMYYRSDTWTLLTNGMFWLGPDPSTMSAGWGMAYYRTCVWGRFQHTATGASVCVLNTHYETPGNDEAQKSGSNIILERIKANCDASDSLVVVTGDFNALKSYPAMQILFENNLEDPSDEGTFCGDMLSATCSVKYDFTLFRAQSKNACHLKSEISRIDYDGCYSSDHAGLVGSFCFQGSCCSNDTSSSTGSNDSSYLDDSVTGESDVVGTVQASNTDKSGTATGQARDLNYAEKAPQPATPPSFSGDAQTISTSSESGHNTSIKVGGILGCVCVCGLIAFVVIRRKTKLEKQTHLEKLDDSSATGYVGGARAMQSMSGMLALSPAKEGTERVSNSTIPELAAIPFSNRISSSSSVSVSNSEDARHVYRITELDQFNGDSNDIKGQPTTQAMGPADSEHPSALSNSGAEIEDNAGMSIISYGNSSVSSFNSTESYSNSSIAMSKVDFSEIFASDSCVSDDSALAKSHTGFALL
uniref:Endonuclease/exonuclease/phosphatase domain-containing protein n=1 Tax=Hyaloperonospora arabidopsidis (strain Emoy2) TaxID=559515 RepID=M4BA25_HYAAE